MKTYTAYLRLHRGRGKHYPGTENIRLENVTIEQIKARLNKEGWAQASLSLPGSML